MADALADLPLDVAQMMVTGMLGAADEHREHRGREPGLVQVVYVAEPVCPDFLKSPADWRDDLVKAWRALSADDRAAFLSRVTDRRAAA